MQSTTTSTDLLLEAWRFLLAPLIVFAIGTCLWPRLSSKVLTWWAVRSEKSAAKRARRLRRQLHTVDEMRNDYSRYVGYLTRLVADLIFYLVMATAFAIINLVGLGTAITNRSGDTKIILFLMYTFPCVVIVLFGIAFTRSVKLKNYSDLRGYESRIKEAVNRLHR